MSEEIELQASSTSSPLHPHCATPSLPHSPSPCSISREVYHSQTQCASLFSVSPIEVPADYAAAVREQRRVFVCWEVMVAALGPLVFRFALGATDSDTDTDTDQRDDAWGSGLHVVEWIVLAVAFIDTVSWLFRGLPLVSGTPTMVESSLSCVVEGGVALGCCTPIVSEDEAIFLRSLLGRTCTALATCTGRHRVRGLYADTILNEKRGAGEEARRHMWFAWQHFVAALVRISRARRNQQQQQQQANHTAESGADHDKLSEADVVMRRMRLSSIFQSPSSYGKSEKHPHKENKGQCQVENQLNSINENYADSSCGSKPVVDTSNGNIPVKVCGPSSGSNSVSGQPRRSRLQSIFSKEAFAPREGSDVNSLPGTATGVESKSGGGMSLATKAKRRPSRINSLYSTAQPEHTMTRVAIENGMMEEESTNGGNETSSSTTARSSWRDADSCPKTKVNLSREEQLKRDRLQNERVTVDEEDIAPLSAFLHAWLEVVKDREWTYNYWDTREALSSLFLAAPFMDHFDEDDVLEVHGHLSTLFEAFAVVDMQFPTTSQTSKAPLPAHPEKLCEVHWTLTKVGAPSWDITWGFFCRARLRPIDETTIKWAGSVPLFQCTRIKPGAIVCEIPPFEGKAADYLKDWQRGRSKLLKVESVRKNANGEVCVEVQPFVEFTSQLNGPSIDAVFPYSDAGCNEVGDSMAANKGSATRRTIMLDALKLVECNRGKAGAMNIYADYMRAATLSWLARTDQTIPVQVFEGVVDARHMLAEPDIFWNEALPYFSLNKNTLAPTKGLGGAPSTTKYPPCMLVQYPQCFTNVNHKDYLDNTNGAYYTLWQTLRDGAKVATSSGSNAIWDVTNPEFTFATTSRIEDTGTSHDYLYHSMTVSMPCFVAYGIAKKTEDFLEAVYRWSAGAVELFWGGFFSKKIVHFAVVGCCTWLFAMACFAESSAWFYSWIAVLLLAGLKICLDKHRGHKPLRSFIVSTVVVVNLTNWMANMLSPTWTVLVPIYMATTASLPLASNDKRALFWLFAGVILRLPQAFMTDCLANICRLANPVTKNWNFDMTLWRSSQLFACSFGYSFLSICAGTASAFRAKFHDHDLTMWSSFRVTNAVMAQAWSRVLLASNLGDTVTELIGYGSLKVKSFVAACKMPDVATKWLVLSLFTVQVVCLASASLNVEDVSVVIVLFVVCGLNFCLVIDITLLLNPILGQLMGNPTRPEYVLGLLSFGLLILNFSMGSVGVQYVFEALHLN